MSNFSALKTAIQNAIKQNGNEEITGDVLQQILLSIVSTMGDGAINTIEQNLSQETTARQEADTQLQNALNAISTYLAKGYIFAGVATPTGTPVSGRVFYVATTAGRYTSFGNLQVQNGISILLVENGSWTLHQLLVVDFSLVQNSNNPVRGGAVYQAIQHEETERRSADTRLQNNINNENSRAVSVENGLHQEIVVETDKRKQEIQGMRDDVLDLIHEYRPIEIEGNVVNAPDEEDITQQPNNLLKFKDKDYNPTIFSGLGRKYLRKNIVINEDYTSFDGFEMNPEADAMLGGQPDSIFWDRLRERFIAEKDGVYYLDWQGSGDYIPVSADKIYVNENIPYFWNGEDLAVDDDVIARYGNSLTQEMMSDANTIYVIQYDYTLGEDITVPANCVLEFDGGSINGNNNITFNNTKLKGDISFNSINPSGLINTDFIYVDWFNVDNTGTNDCTAVLQKIANWSTEIIVPIKFGYGTYKISNTITFQNGAWKFRGIYGDESVTNIYLDSYNDIPAILIINGSGKESKAIIKNIQFTSNGIEHNILLELRGCNQVHINNCYFYNARYGVKLSNDIASGTFTEGNTIDECRFSSSCGTALWYYKGAGDESFHGSGINSAWIDTSVGYNTIIISSNAKVYNAPLTCQILKFHATEADAPLILNNGKGAYMYGTLTVESSICECGGGNAIYYRGDVLVCGAISHGTLNPVTYAGTLGPNGGNTSFTEPLPKFGKHELTNGESVNLGSNGNIYLCSFTAGNGSERFFILGGSGNRYNSSPVNFAPIFCSGDMRDFIDIEQGNNVFVITAKTTLTLYTKVIMVFGTYNKYARFIQ